MTPSIAPPRLRRGDLIGLVSPASTPSPDEKVHKATLYLESLGYRVRHGNHVLACDGYLAGSDTDRAEDLNAMIRDPLVKAIFATRGGYGTPRLLPLVDYKALAKSPKIISGFSDITGLEMAIHRKTRIITFSGAMPCAEMWNSPDPYTEEAFWRLLTSKSKPGLLSNPQGNPTKMGSPGVAEGLLLGGNLALVASTLGTPYCPSFRRAVLALEDVDEYPHRLDRMFAQLRNAGILKNVAGLVLGQFTHCKPKDPAQPHLTADQVLAQTIEWTPRPSLLNLQYGHIPKKLTLPLGAMARLDATKGTLRILEACVS